ncbi:TonB-dependent siderophore receptor [Pseudomonas sp. 148P]|uniref:TonB-dependent siderophore receptor n=1 Tax=Pseudomonas ulcerans TaxID=3115852 RepID=A0ABU7HQ13_9PSED|nr:MULTISPECIES: TonB-dependent siderophore receptor [unclassified Pseudomonas]MEE1922609.1 TonB-dependent siderophore receptor [Pseudomonas sp. 147P]MEE1933586.1 TonB-dependent siderophore receptor [Pseudomonas sp. 148P]
MSVRCTSRRGHPALPQFSLNRTFAAVQMALLLGLGGASMATLAAEAEAPAKEEAKKGNLELGETRVEGTLDSVESMPPVYAGGQVATGGRVGLLGNKDFMETPFSTVSYTDEFIQNIQAKDITDVISATDPAVFSNGLTGTYSENYSIRGFQTAVTDMTVDGLFGMAPYYRASPEMYERIEVLKGPSALLNGMPPGGSVGGTVNLIPKRAGDTPLTRLTATYESDAQFGGHIDVARRFGEGNQFGVRFNGVYRDGDTATDDQSKRNTLSSLALDWRGERAKLSLDLFDADDTIRGQNRGIGLNAGVAVPSPPKNTTLLNPDWAYVESKDKGVILRGEYEINDQLLAYGAIGTTKTDYKYNGTMTAVVINSAGDYTTTMGQLQMQIYKTSAEVGLRGHFDTFGINHQWSVNATQYRDKEKDWGRRSVPGANWTTNIYNPVWGPEAPQQWPLVLHTENNLKSYGIADTMSILDDRLQLTLGVRRQEVVTDTFSLTTGARNKPNYDTHATTPAGAILFKLTDDLSLYANYIEGLSKGARAPVTSNNPDDVFPPYKSKQKEVGLKLDLGTFSHTLSLYEIKRPSSYTDSATNIFSFGGEQRNRGVEWSFFGSPLPDWRLMGGIAYADPEITKAAVAANEGKKATAYPKLQGKLGVEWDTPLVDGLTLTGNATSVSKQYINADNSLSIPGYTIFDVGARYSTKIASKPVVFRAGIENLTDKDYWGVPLLASLGLGAPRTYLLSASVDF